MQKQDYVTLAGVIVIIIIMIITITIYIKKTSYDIFTINEENQCEKHTERCNCFGKLATKESYPPQYTCDGREWCRDINIEVCE